MTWTKLDDDLYSHPKALELSDAAGWLIVRIWAWIGRHGTDGAVPPGALRALHHSPEALAELVAKGWLHERAHLADQCRHTPNCGDHLRLGDVDGWVAHDYLDRNPTRAENATQRQKIKERKSPKLRNLVYERDEHRCRYCGRQVSRFDHVSAAGFQLDHVNPEVACGAGGVVTSCKGCNSKKKDRTPSEAGMTLLPPPAELPEGLDDPWLNLHELDPNGQPGSDPAPSGDQPGSGRVGSGPGRVGGSLTPHRLAEDNPYLRSGRLLPELDPAFEKPDPPPPPAQPARASPPRSTSRSKRPRKRKGRRR